MSKCRTFSNVVCPGGSCDCDHEDEQQTENANINNFILELAEHEGYDLSRPELHAMRHFRTTVRALLVKHGLVFA